MLFLKVEFSTYFKENVELEFKVLLNRTSEFMSWYCLHSFVLLSGKFIFQLAKTYSTFIIKKDNAHLSLISGSFICRKHWSQNTFMHFSGFHAYIASLYIFQ